MNLLRAIVTNIVLALLSWVSILFAFTAGNILVLGYAGVVAPVFGWLIILALVLNAMTGILVSGIWYRKYESSWDFIALLSGFVLACISLGILASKIEHISVFGDIFSHYEAHEVMILSSIPVLTVFACILFFWKNKHRDN